MINKRLINLFSDKRKDIIFVIFLKLFSLFLSIGMIFAISNFISSLIIESCFLYRNIIILFIIMILKVFLILKERSVTNTMSCEIKKRLRTILYDRVKSHKMRYSKKFEISEVVSLSVNAVENLDLYITGFLPQLFYAIIGPFIIFIVLSTINITISILLLLMIPFIPISIMMVQKLAKKVNIKYWGSYLELSEMFLDFLSGLSTLIIFGTDKEYNEKLNDKARAFRVNTMKVLSIQLNNLTVLDLISYIGASIAIILVVIYYSDNIITLNEAMVVILISAEFFLPLRKLGSLFHVVMNGMGSLKFFFDLMDREKDDEGKNLIPNIEDSNIQFKNINFSYNRDRQILKNINMTFTKGKIIYIVGKSGCGKSTIASLIMNKYVSSSGEILYNNVSNPKTDEILKLCTLVTNNSYLFNKSLKYNLTMGNTNIKDDSILKVLNKMSLQEYSSLSALEDIVLEGGNNFSGGERQRIVLSRAILKDSPILILDEATSNIDPYSEDIIMEYLKEIKENKTIIIISHRLKYTKDADYIYYMEDGKIVEEGDFKSLMDKNKRFKDLYENQMKLLNWGLNHEKN